MRTYSKIDDGLHTNNYNWQQTWNDHDGRYTAAYSMYGIENANIKDSIIIGSPSSPLSFAKSSRSINGIGQTCTLTDPTNHCEPFTLDTLFDSQTYPPFLTHDVGFWNDINPAFEAHEDDFEDLNYYVKFVRQVHSYDRLPERVGNVWGNMPEVATLNNLAPGGAFANLKGKEAAVAYRDEAGEPFHYSFYSYDPRGRLAAIIRYNENLGYDAVYYTYNSQNKVIKIKVLDPLRQYSVWYSYDHNGRTDSGWTRLGDVGTGFGTGTPSMPQDITKPLYADLGYEYTARSEVQKVSFMPADVRQSFEYTSRGFLASTVAKHGNDTLFWQWFERDNTNRITDQYSVHDENWVENYVQQTYGYDTRGRITSYSENKHDVTTEYFSYDGAGNRLGSSHAGDSTVYEYEDPLRPNRLTKVSNNQSTYYTYNANGGVSKIAKLQGGDSLSSEEFVYTGGGLVKKFIKKLFGELPEHFYGDKYEWRYRYSAGGAREQKRQYLSPTYDSLGASYAWTYYLLGAAGDQMAIFEGRQSKNDFNDCSPDTRKVALYPAMYMAQGGLLSQKPDGTKEFQVRDHLGTVRTVASYNQGQFAVRHYDYLPFGDTLWTSEGDHNREGHEGKDFDLESNYMSYGYRLYDPQTGRFMQPDPLLEAFPSITPYCYSYNSPLGWRDPSGLAPVKEKREKLQYIVLDLLHVEEGYKSAHRANQLGMCLNLKLMIITISVSISTDNGLFNYNIDPFTLNYNVGSGATNNSRSSNDAIAKQIMSDLALIFSTTEGRMLAEAWKNSGAPLELNIQVRTGVDIANYYNTNNNPEEPATFLLGVRLHNNPKKDAQTVMLAAEIFDLSNNSPELEFYTTKKSYRGLPTPERMTSWMTLAHELGHVWHSLLWGNGGFESQANAFLYRVMRSLGTPFEYDDSGDIFDFDPSNPFK